MARKKNEKTEVITSYKGFNGDLQCRGFQFEIGKEYEHEGKVEACASGFHACEYPLDVFGYYAPGGNRFALVEQSGDLSRENGDSKVASRKIAIKAELTIAGLVKAAIEYTSSRCTPIDPESPASSTGTRGAASSTGPRGAASSTGDYGAATSTGDCGAASSTGDYGAASSTGTRGAASSTGTRGAASSTGYQGAASSTGYQGAASSTGKHSVAIAAGIQGKAMASAGSAIVLCYRDKEAEGDDYGRILHIKAGIAGKDGIEPNTWYQLSADGEFVKVD
ncbi:MAG: hypothetical protein U1D65_12820 [Pseudomonas sp.]|nr:hypothetical protein [Pseudomonas sp.]MDZ4192883.1 hypothetical protein [Pseudomonas sp.]